MKKITTTTTRRTEIKLESSEVRTMKLRFKRQPVECERCGATVDAFTPDKIAEFLNVTVAEVHGLIDAGEVHLVGQNPSLPLICSNARSNK